MSALEAVAAAYADHVGVPRPSAAALRERIAPWPAWARASVRASAWALRWLAPAALLRRPRRFEELSQGDAERLLLRLQGLRAPAARGAFLTVKAAVLGCCYGARP